MAEGALLHPTLVGEPDASKYGGTVALSEVNCQLHAMMQAELLKNVVHVRPHRHLSDAKLFGYISVSHPAANQLDDLRLPSRQVPIM